MRSAACGMPRRPTGRRPSRCWPRRWPLTPRRWPFRSGRHTASTAWSAAPATRGSPRRRRRCPVLKRLAIGVAKPESARAEAQRIRRLALTTLLTLGAVDETFSRAALDSDPQIRRLAIAGVAAPVTDEIREAVVAVGLIDALPMVKWEALRVHGRHYAAADCGPETRRCEGPEPRRRRCSRSTCWRPRAQPRRRPRRRWSASRRRSPQSVSRVPPRPGMRRPTRLSRWPGVRPMPRGPNCRGFSATPSGRCGCTPHAQPPRCRPGSPRDPGGRRPRERPRSGYRRVVEGTRPRRGRDLPARARSP